jgi:hypothetical protein
VCTIARAARDRPLHDAEPMRDPRYRFSDDVRAATRALALRMLHAKTVASSSEELHAWIVRTEDLREKLTKGGYGSAFTADDLFPLFQGFVAKASTPTPSRSKSAPARSAWVAIIVIVVVLIVVGVIVAGRIAS